MNLKTYRNIIEYRMGKCKKLLFSKGAEYAPDADVFANFDHAASVQNTSSACIAWNYAMKHIISIQELLSFAQSCDGGRHFREECSKRFSVSVEASKEYFEAMLQEKLQDAINYLFIISCMTDGDAQIPRQEDPRGTPEACPRDMNALAQKAYSIAQQRGFYQHGATLDKNLLHLYSEVAEACQASKNDTDNIGEFFDELADVIINASNIATHLGGDVAEIIANKLRKDEGRIPCES